MGSMADTRLTGQAGEDLAAAYLRHHGYHILVRNYRCRIGEIDIIAFHHGVMVFVEVKTRANPSALPEEAVHRSKRRKLTRIARNFIMSRRLTHLPCQFDVVAIGMTRAGTQQIEHFVDAFEACD